MGFRIGKRLVPYHTIMDRMDRKDLRFQADARRREAEHRTLPDHQQGVTLSGRSLAPRRFQTYRLPDGRCVEIDATAAKGNILVSFTLENGQVVDAVRVDPSEGR